MTEKERIEEIRFFLKKNKTEFAKVLGYTTPQSYTNYLSSNGGSVSIKMLRALKDYEPRISVDWILNGHGQMLLNNDIFDLEKIINGDGNNTQVGHFTNSDTNISTGSNNKEIEYLKKEIEHLKVVIEEKEQRLQEKDQRLKDKERLISILEKNQK